MMNKTHSLKPFVNLVGLHIYIILSLNWPFLGVFSGLKITKNKETKIKVH